MASAPSSLERWPRSDKIRCFKRQAYEPAFGRGATLQRYKGLGEMNADQLWETTMNPETRTLIRVTIDDLARAERRVSVLMGDKAAPRRQWIEDNVKFTLEENTVF